jgi:hypothetical protein
MTETFALRAVVIVDDGSCDVDALLQHDRMVEVPEGKGPAFGFPMGRQLHNRGSVFESYKTTGRGAVNAVDCGLSQGLLANPAKADPDR